jgi:hypothetical protein
MGMSAVDKILHEAIANNFMALLQDGFLDRSVEMKVSRSYEIAINARERRGRGGRVRARPGHRVKAEVMSLIYRDSFLACRRVEELCSALGKRGIFAKFGSSLTPHINGEAARNRWHTIYMKRNAIAHEADIVRMAMPRRVEFHDVRTWDYKLDIDFIGKFGRFMSGELD